MSRCDRRAIGWSDERRPICYDSSRLGAQTSQFSAVTSEWEQMSSVTKSKIEQYRQEKVRSGAKKSHCRERVGGYPQETSIGERRIEKTRGQSPSFFRWAILKSLTLEPNDYGGRRRCTLLG
jgi:ribosomal protein L32E